MWFGLATAPKIILAAAFVFFVVFMNMVAGVYTVNPQQANALRVMGAGRFELLTKLILPGTVPYLMTGLRLAVPEALIGAVVGEFISANRGLGYLVTSAAAQFNTAGTMAAILALLLIVAVMDAGPEPCRAAPPPVASTPGSVVCEGVRRRLPAGRGVPGRSSSGPEGARDPHRGGVPMRTWKVLAPVAALLGRSTGASASEAQALVKVKQAGFKVIDLAVPFVAKYEGFFERNGLDWEYVEIDSGKLGVAALLSGNAQFTDFAVDDTAALQTEGKGPILVYSMVNSLTMDMVVRNDVLERLKVTPRSPRGATAEGAQRADVRDHAAGRGDPALPVVFLLKGGFDPEKDATFVQIGGGQALVAAVKAKRIDAFMLSAPAPYLLERDKVGTVVLKNSAGEGPPEFGDFAFECIAVLKSWAEKNPRLVEAYIRSLNQAYDWMLSNLSGGAGPPEEVLRGDRRGDAPGSRSTRSSRLSGRAAG